ncbi:MAG TPA: carboxymuconolactone decarboxylase family protein [Lentisphaeria bacterium]|nr:MAG: carboxymuconolactone decarboxylase [Lentisphaerae bacterium GWF2_38_69]HBM17366.1 carboxymuconolactone decarboxylase family protein [Lentisphaeria bacterium]
MKHYSSVPLPEDNQLSHEMAKELKRFPPLNIHRLLTLLPDDCRRGWMDSVSAIYKTDFNPKLREIAICRYGFKTNCKYELHQHIALAKNMGITEDELKIILSEREVKSLTEEENLICKAVDEFEDLAGVSEATLNELLNRYSVQKTMVFFYILSHYTCVTRVLNSTKIPLEPISPLSLCKSPVG